jgi:hypothetical protein
MLAALACLEWGKSVHAYPETCITVGWKYAMKKVIEVDRAEPDRPLDGAQQSRYRQFQPYRTTGERAKSRRELLVNENNSPS